MFLYKSTRKIRVHSIRISISIYNQISLLDHSASKELACIASVAVGFGSKERPRNGIFGVFPARKMGREPKNERGEWGRGTKDSPSPSFLFLALALFFTQEKHQRPEPPGGFQKTVFNLEEKLKFS